MQIYPLKKTLYLCIVANYFFLDIKKEKKEKERKKKKQKN